MQNNLKLTTILLIIIILLLIGGIYTISQRNSQTDVYIKKNEFISDIITQSDQIKPQSSSSQNSTTTAGKIFEGSGFSLIVPKIYEKSFDYISDTNSISRGTTGKSMRKYFTLYPDPFFYVSAMTTDFRAERGIDCGEVKKYPTIEDGYELRTNKIGFSYMYRYELDVDGYFGGSHQLAYFKLNNSEFPVLGFCASTKISDSNFYSVVDTVVIK